MAGVGKDNTTEDGLIALVTAVRWATTLLGLFWAAVLAEDAATLTFGLLLVAYALFRTFRPVAYRRAGWKSVLSIIVELGAFLIVVIATDCWDSTYIFTLFTPIIAAGFERGYGHAIRIAATASIAIAASAPLTHADNELHSIVSWTVEFLLVAVVASYGRRLIHRARTAGGLSLSQLWQLNEANSLLVGLNRLSSELPVSFDFHETLENALVQARDATNPDVSAILLREPSSTSWTVSLSEGARLPDSYEPEHLPAALADAATHHDAQLATNLSDSHRGLDESSAVGIYVPLWAGDRQVGLIAVEAGDQQRFTKRQVAALQELAQPLALTIDNARWFERLRARGATQERTRIARDLHDRVGQGVAYVAFELERLSGVAHDTPLEQDLGLLRDDARSIVRELRETLYELRTDVSQEYDLRATIEEFLGRIGNRSAIETSLTYDASARLPLMQESEVWRIAQEAIVNAERHADATEINVAWTYHDGRGTLTVTDNGSGMDGAGDSSLAHGESASIGRPSYGLTGMRERADVLGARLEVHTADSGGTIVRLELNRRGPITVEPSKQETHG